MKKLLLFCLLLLNINVFANEDLKELKVNGQEVKCSGYECSIEVNSDNAEITYKLGENVKSTKPESGYKISIENDHSMQIEIIYQDDTMANYTVKIIKHVASSDNTLEKLVINEEEVELKNDIFVYSFETEFNDDKIIIEGTPNDKNAKCEKKEFEFNLEKSSLSLEYPVKAENGDIKKYTIIFKRKNKPDTTLKTLTLSDIEFDFDSKKLDYEVTIPYSVDSTEIKAIPNVKEAKVEISMEEFFVVGENFIKITVTNKEASDIYTVKINRLEKIDETIAYLSLLKIEEYDLKFKPNIFDYKLFFEKIPNSLYLDYKTKTKDAKVEIDNNENLNDGSVISIKVSLENGLMKVYKLHINLQENDDKEEVNKTLIVVLIVILIVVMIILLILQIKEKGKNNKRTKKHKENKSKKKILEEEIEVI